MNKYIFSVIFLLVFDILWLKLFMINKYDKMIINIQQSKLEGNLKYAIPAYILMIIGLIHFVIPNIKPGSELNDSLEYGALFGIIIYGIYNFTCGTIFKNWNINIAIIDILWGGFLYFISSYISIKYEKKLIL
jgi:uncharacterized membrane protein